MEGMADGSRVGARNGTKNGVSEPELTAVAVGRAQRDRSSTTIEAASGYAALR